MVNKSKSDYLRYVGYEKPWYMPFFMAKRKLDLRVSHFEKTLGALHSYSASVTGFANNFYYDHKTGILLTYIALEPWAIKAFDKKELHKSNF